MKDPSPTGAPVPEITRASFRIQSNIRYLNVLLVAFFLSSIPMPVDKNMLAICSAAALAGNFLIHIYSNFSRNYQIAAYMLFVMDLLTLMPAVYFSGMFGSPFLLFLPLTIYNVYFLGLKMRAYTAFSSLAIGLFAGLVIYSWHHIVSHPSWTPIQYPEYTLFVAFIQLSALGIIIYQAWSGPAVFIRDLRSKEALLSAELPRARLGTSISMIAHEIRNPMTTISLTLEQCRLMSKYLPASIRRKFNRSWNICSNEIARIDRMLENVLAFSRHDPGKYAIAPFPARKVIDRAIQFTRKKHPAPQLAFSTSCKIRKNQLLCCDPDAIHQVLVNILDNAIQNRKSNERLRLAIDLVQDVGFSTLTIIDNGNGIPPDKLPAIFERYMSARHGGTGLGLAVARQIIEDHHGSIDVKSTHGEGTTFILSLPDTSVSLKTPG